MAQQFALSSPARHPHLVAAALACTFVLLLAGGGWSAWQQGWLARWLRAEDPASTALLQVTSEPSSVAISVDGRERGRTPASVAVAPGQHVVAFSGSQVIPTRREVTVGAEGASVAEPLWLREPRITRLRPTYPGASVATTTFASDGRLVLVIAMPSGGRQAWLLDPASGTLARIGPAGQWAALAVAPDGEQAAYLAASTSATATASPGPMPAGSSPNSRLDQVWVAGGAAGVPRLVFQLTTAGERLVDLSWSPDSRQLLLVTRQTLALGGEQTRLLWLAASGDEPRELLTLPGQVVPGSYTWATDGRAVAFLARPGTGPQTAVCLLEPATASFRYLGDLVSDGSTGAATAAAPVAWDGAGTALYAVTAAQAAREDTPLFGLQPIGGPRSTLGLFRGRSAAGTDDERLPAGDGLTGLAVRNDGTILGLVRPKSTGPLLLRGIDAAGSQADDLAELSVPGSASSASLAARWDLAHAQAVLALPTGSLTETAPADYWLVRFETAANREVSP